MPLSLQALRTSLQAHPGDPRVTAVFGPDEQRILWSAASLGAQAPPNWMLDLGSKLVSSIQQQVVTVPPERLPWMARSSAALLGLLLQARIGAWWSPPSGTPVFMEVTGDRAGTYLISPLRLILDVMVPSGNTLTEAYKGLIDFPRNNQIPASVFRVSPYGIDAARRPTWQWSWALVATVGRFRDGAWDLNFQENSLPRLAQLVEGLGDLGMSGVALDAVDQDASRRWMWLRTAVSAYLAELFYRSYGQYGLRIHAQPTVPASGILFGPNHVDLGQVVDDVKAGDRDAFFRLARLLAT